MAPELEVFRGEFDAAAADADDLLAPLSNAQFYRSPSPERWSVAQCVEHRNVTARDYLPLDDAIATVWRWGVYSNAPFGCQRRHLCQARQLLARPDRPRNTSL